jgi:excinuclease UvrABC nuclease subunit
MSNSITPSNGGNKIYMTIQDVLNLDWQKNPKLPRSGKGGVYRIVDRSTGGLLYIGQATNLSHRLLPSVHHVYDRNKHDVYIVFEQDHNERCKMEYRLIQIMKPKLNIRNGTSPVYSEEELREAHRRIFG